MSDKSVPNDTHELKTEPHDDSDLMRFLWQAWPWLAWLAPPILVLMRLGNGGWESLFLLITLPLAWPTVSLLAMLPRFVLRKRGFTSLPISVGIAMFSSMLGMVVGLLSMPGTSDVGHMDSPLRDSGVFQSSRAEEIAFDASITLCLVGYVVALVCAFSLRRSSPGLQNDGPPRNALSRWSPEFRLGAGILLVAIGFPLVVTGTVVAFKFGEKDAAGDREIDVAWLSAEQSRARQEQHWDEAQKDLQATRRAISDKHWLVGEYGGTWGESNGTSQDTRYRISADWDLKREGNPESVGSSLLVAIEGQGWKLHPDDSDPWDVEPEYETIEDVEGTITGVSYNFKNAKSQRLEFSVSRPSEEIRDDSTVREYSDQLVVTLRLQTDWYWLEGGENEMYNVVDWNALVEGSESEDFWQSGTEFSYSEWPTLKLVETKPL